jgi:hypothetical protein
MKKKSLKSTAKATKAIAATSGTSSKNLKGAACEDSALQERIVEIHIGMGWKTAFGLHLAEKEQKTWENYKMSPGIYLHPKSRHSTFRLLKNLWLWVAPFTVWTKEGPYGFISRNRAVDFYYKVSSKLIGSESASIERTGWARSAE